MNEKHLTSLPLSQKLKAAGCPQVSEFWWLNLKQGWTLLPTEEAKEYDPIWPVSAYLASELELLLPSSVTYSKIDNESHWAILNDWGHSYDHGEHADTLSEAMGLMLLYLAEQGFIKFKNN